MPRPQMTDEQVVQWAHDLLIDEKWNRENTDCEDPESEWQMIAATVPRPSVEEARKLEQSR